MGPHTTGSPGRQPNDGKSSSSRSSGSDGREHASSSPPKASIPKRKKLHDMSANQFSDVSDQQLMEGIDVQHRAADNQVQKKKVGGGNAQQLTTTTRHASAAPSQERQQARPVTAQTPRKPAAALPWECPNCGTSALDHDPVLCTADRRTDMTRTVEAYQWLKRLDNLRRDQRILQRQSAAMAGESDDGEEIGSQSEASEEEEGEEGEGEGSSFLDDTSSYQPSSSDGSSLARSAQAPSKSPSKERSAIDTRLDRMEAMLLSIHSGHQQQPSHAREPSSIRFSTSPVRTHAPTDSSFREASRESPTRTCLPTGMLGCPEVEKREDLLVMSKFEALEKKYADYVDRAQDHDRTPQTMAHCFRKYLGTIVMSLNSLLSRDAAVRRKYRELCQATTYTVDDEQLKQWDAHTFACMYRELCTAKTFMASEVITKLMDTKFSRHPPRGQDPYTLTAFVI